MTDDKQRKTPVLRFKGFHDDWEQRKLGNISEIITGGTPSTKIISYWQPSEINWLSSGEINKRIINDSDRKISKKGLENSSAKLIPKDTVLIALAGQGKTRGKVAITNINTAINQSLAGIKLNKPFSNYFLFYELSKKYQKLRQLSSGNSTRGGLNKKLISSLHITFSTNKEQKKIANLLFLVDHLISLQQRKIDNLDSIKESLLQGIFPNREGIRKFTISNNIWKTKKINSIFKERRSRNKNGRLLSVSILNGVYPFNENERKDNSNKNKDHYKVVKIGDLAYNSMRMWQGAVGVSKYNGIVSPAYTVIVPKNGENAYFYYYYFKNKRMLFRFRRNSQGITSDTWNLKFPLFKEILLLTTEDNAEQTKIFQIFQQLDSLINKNKFKILKLKRIKQFLLQNMFI